MLQGLSQYAEWHTHPKTRDAGLLPSPQPRSGIVVLLVGLVGALGVADLRLHVVLVLVVELPHSIPAGPLRRMDQLYVCVCVHAA